MPFFCRTQQGVILLLGAVLLAVLGWRANFGRDFPPPPASPLTLVFVEVDGAGAYSGVFAFDHSPALAEVLERARVAKGSAGAETRLESGARISIQPGGGYNLSLMNGARLLMLGQALDLNSATAADLEALPGIGPALAARILAYRQAHGPFQKVEDLEKVSGIGPKKLEKLKTFVIVGNRETPTGED
jgi:competence protein ComEA